MSAQRGCGQGFSALSVLTLTTSSAAFHLLRPRVGPSIIPSIFVHLWIRGLFFLARGGHAERRQRL